MNNKEMFAETIHWLGDGNLSANECERYGMTWGCDGDCPAFSKGKCKNPEELIEDIMTTDKFDNFTFEELNKLYPKLNLPINN